MGQPFLPSYSITEGVNALGVEEGAKQGGEHAVALAAAGPRRQPSPQGRTACSHARLCLLNLHLYTYLLLPMCTVCVAKPVGARRGHGVPRNWSYKRLLAVDGGAGNRTWVICQEQ